MNHSTNSSNSDSDYDVAAEDHDGEAGHVGAEVGTGSWLPTSSRLSKTQGNLCPSKALAEYAKGIFDPKKF